MTLMDDGVVEVELPFADKSVLLLIKLFLPPSSFFVPPYYHW